MPFSWALRLFFTFLHAEITSLRQLSRAAPHIFSCHDRRKRLFMMPIFSSPRAFADAAWLHSRCRSALAFRRQAASAAAAESRAPPASRRGKIALICRPAAAQPRLITAAALIRQAAEPPRIAEAAEFLAYFLRADWLSAIVRASRCWFHATSRSRHAPAQHSTARPTAQHTPHHPFHNAHHHHWMLFH